MVPELRIPIFTKGITFTEVPNRVAVFFEIGNCRSRCKGCHSTHLWSDDGAEWMTVQEILDYIKEQLPFANAVCFMGGTTNGLLDIEFVMLLSEVGSETGLPICLYHGDDVKPSMDILEYLTWVKIGKYREELGGLDKETTNQRFYKVEWHEYWSSPIDRETSIELIDITERFRRGEIDEKNIIE